MRIVRAPHQGFDPDIVDQPGADPVELEGGAALAFPILARLQRHQIAETVLPLEIHAVERVGDPADAALAKADPQIRIAVQHAGANHRGDDVIKFIWKPATPVNLAVRRKAAGAFSRTLRGGVGKVWKWSGNCTSLTAFHKGSQHGCHIGSMSHEQDSSRPLRPSLATR